MRSRHSVEEKFEIVMEALTENTAQAEICRRHGIFPTQLAKWKEQFIESGKKGLSDGSHPHSGEEEIDDLKRMIGERTYVTTVPRVRVTAMFPCLGHNLFNLLSLTRRGKIAAATAISRKLEGNTKEIEVNTVQ